MLLLWRIAAIGTNRYLLLLLPQRSRRRRKHPIVLWCLVDHVHIIRTVYNRLVEDQLVYGVIDGIERSSDRDSSAVPSRRDVPTFPMFSIVQEARVGGLEGSRGLEPRGSPPPGKREVGREVEVFPKHPPALRKARSFLLLFLLALGSELRRLMRLMRGYVQTNQERLRTPERRLDEPHNFNLQSIANPRLQEKTRKSTSRQEKMNPASTLIVLSTLAAVATGKTIRGGAHHRELQRNRIIGGSEAQEDRYSFAVSLQDRIG